MQGEIKVIDGKNIVYAHFSGSITVEDRYKNSEEIIATCRKHGIKKILADTRGQISKSKTIDLFNFAKEFKDATKGYYVAIVRDKTDSDVKFMDNVAGNRGAQCKTFLDVKEAEQWLDEIE